MDFIYDTILRRRDPSGPEGTRRGLGFEFIYNEILREGTRTPFSIYNNIGGWGGESPRTSPHNIVLGPHCPKRDWSNNLLTQFGNQRARKQQYSGDWPVTGIISLRFWGSGGCLLARVVAKNFLCGPTGATLLFNLSSFGVVGNQKLMQEGRDYVSFLFQSDNQT